MKKLVKILIGVAVTLVVLLVVFLLTLPFTITPIVKTAAAAGSKMLEVPIDVSDIKLNPFLGNLTIHGVKVGNPKGYSESEAFAVDKVEVGLNLLSLKSDTVIIRKIEIDAPAIRYEVKDGVSNFDAILARVNKAHSEEKKEKEKTEKAPGKKVIIEAFTLSGAKVAYASGITLGQAITLPLPTLELHDIGKASGGATALEVVTSIIDSVVGSLTSLVKGAAGLIGDAVKGTAGAVGDAVKDTADAATKAVGSLKDAILGRDSSGQKAEKDTAKESLDATKEAATDAVDAVKDTAKDAAGAAKDAAKSLKNLFK